MDVTSTQLAQTSSSGSVWYGKADLENLRPNTQYMVQVSSLNNEGYSKFSEITIFSTSKEGLKQDIKIQNLHISILETYQKEAVATSGTSSLKTHLVLIINFLMFSRIVLNH